MNMTPDPPPSMAPGQPPYPDSDPYPNAYICSNIYPKPQEPPIEICPEIQPGPQEQVGENGSGIDKPSEPIQSQNGSTDPETAVIHGVGWNRPTFIFGLFILGLLSGLGHHIFYSRLDGKLAHEQKWTIRIGTALAYILGNSLAIMCGLCRDQWLWHTLSKRSFSLKSIDAIFGVTTNPGHFLHFDMVKLAKIATLLAAAKWLFAPLVTLSTPSTISVVMQPRYTSENCTVNSLRFGYEDDPYSVRLQRTDLPYPHMLYLNTSSGGYLRQSSQALKYFTTSAFSGKTTAKASGVPYGTSVRSHCGSNCTYSVEFIGPSVNCTEIDPLTIGPYTETHLRDLADCAEPPSYGNDTATRYLPIFHSGRWNNSLTSLWALYTVPAAPEERVACRKKHAYTCRASVSRYTVNETMSGYSFLEPRVVSVEKLYNIDDAHRDYAYAPNWAQFDTLVSLLQGERGWYITNGVTEGNYTRKPAENATTFASATPLVNYDHTTHPLGPAIENMVHMMTASLLSDTILHYSANTSAVCISVEWKSIYRYRPFELVLTYSIALAIAAAIALLGLRALFLNREKMDTDSSFISIFHVLRNSNLDHSVPVKEKRLKCKVISAAGEVGFYEVPNKPKKPKPC